MQRTRAWAAYSGQADHPVRSSRSPDHRPGCGADAGGGEARLEPGDSAHHRRTTPEVRRARSKTWTAEELRGAFERQAEAGGRDADAGLRPCCKRMETPMWTGSGRTHPTRRLTSPWVVESILRGGFETLRRFIAFFVSGRTLIAFRLRPQVGAMREAPDFEVRVAEPIARGPVT